MSMKKWLAGLCALFLLLTGCTPAAEEVPSTNTPTEEESPLSISDIVEQLMAMRDLDEIFALENDTDFAIALGSALDDWTEYGQYLDRLSPEAQVFYLCEAVENKVNCDGLYGFILEFYGHWAPETVDALETVGAPKRQISSAVRSPCYQTEYAPKMI